MITPIFSAWAKTDNRLPVSKIVIVLTCLRTCPPKCHSSEGCEGWQGRMVLVFTALSLGTSKEAAISVIFSVLTRTHLESPYFIIFLPFGYNHCHMSFRTISPLSLITDQSSALNKKKFTSCRK